MPAKVHNRPLPLREPHGFRNLDRLDAHDDDTG